MPTFTPQAQNTVPPVLPVGDPEQSAGAYALMRHFRARPEGINVYVLSNGVITEVDPDSVTVFWAESDTTRTTEPYVTFVFWGGTGPYTITQAMADALTSEALPRGGMMARKKTEYTATTTEHFDIGEHAFDLVKGEPVVGTDDEIALLLENGHIVANDDE